MQLTIRYLGGTLSVTADSELTVSQGYSLTLSQAGGLALGANALTLSLVEEVLSVEESHSTMQTVSFS